MKTIILLCATAFCFSIKAQVNFSAQANGSTVTFSITQGTGYELYYFNFGDGTGSYVGYPYNYPTGHTYSVSGNYTVCLIGYPMPMAPNDTICKSINVISTGIQNISLEDQIYFFPNPVKDKLNMELPYSNAKFQLTVTNILGKSVYGLDNINGRQPAIDLSFLTSGVYFVIIQNGSAQKILRILKE